MLTLTTYSHHFTVSGLDTQTDALMRSYCKGLTSYQVTRKPNGDVVTQAHKTFAERTEHDDRIYRLHIELFDAFKTHLENFGVIYKVVEMPLYEPVEAKFKLNPKFKPRDYQEPIIDFICQEGYKRVVTLQTGQGKTAVLLFAIAKLGQRAVLVLQPKYFDRWLDDLSEARSGAMLPLKEGKELMVVQGSADLRSLILLAKGDELDAKLVVISATTYFQYLTYYKEEGLDEKYDFTHPTQLWEVLGAGLVGIDEGHENFHALFRMDLYGNTPKTVTLSATLEPDDPFMKDMYEILYPSRLRADGGKYRRYASMLSVPYSLDPMKEPLKTSWKGRRDYSQLAFEQDILHDKKTDRFENLIAMIRYDIDNFFLPNRFEKHKLLIFFDTVDMCQKVSEILADRYPDLLVGKYTADESYEVLKELEIIVATTKSADTGVDIPELQMVFCFVARGSTQANLQMFGRLRQLKTDKVSPVFLYYWCNDINQHYTYHCKRMEIFQNRTTHMNKRDTFFKL